MRGVVTWVAVQSRGPGSTHPTIEMYKRKEARHFSFVPAGAWTPENQDGSYPHGWAAEEAWLMHAFQATVVLANT